MADPIEALYFDTHCASCGKKQGKVNRIECGECFHPYRTRFGLQIHDWWEWGVKRQFRRSEWEKELGVKFSWKRLIPSRKKKIFSCPCCVHDL